MLKRLHHLKIDIFDLLISCILLFFLVGLVCIDTSEVPADTSIQYINSLDLSGLIVWNTDYSKEIEACIMEELCMLPSDLLDQWIASGGSIVVCSAETGYLDQMKETMQISDGFDTANDIGYTSGFNQLTFSEDGSIIQSMIYLLGDYTTIRNTLLHEVGHFFFYDQFGTDHPVMPHFLEDREKFCACMNSDYFMNQDEYEAELFLYTLHHGTTDLFSDTYSIFEWLIGLSKKKCTLGEKKGSISYSTDYLVG